MEALLPGATRRWCRNHPRPDAGRAIEIPGVVHVDRPVSTSGVRLSTELGVAVNEAMATKVL